MASVRYRSVNGLFYDSKGKMKQRQVLITTCYLGIRSGHTTNNHHNPDHHHTLLLTNEL